VGVTAGSIEVPGSKPVTRSNDGDDDDDDDDNNNNNQAVMAALLVEARSCL
jgi:hypothetical protein